MNLFIDTSALVKLYHEETGTENITFLLNRFAEDLSITISDITRIELHSAFLKRVRIKEIDLDIGRNVFAAFEKDIEMFSVIEVDDVAKSFAVQLLDSIAYQTGLKSLDAIQLSAAIVSHRFVAIDYFVACDKNLLNVAKYYFNILNPEFQTIQKKSAPPP